MITVSVLTISDKGSKGEREDVSGQTIIDICKENGLEIVSYDIVPDEEDIIYNKLIELSDNKVNLILTTGGTGFSKRDVTPEATKRAIQKEASGIVEAIRSYSLTITKRAMLSRAVSGIRNDTLIINLPGSPKAVNESLGYIIDTVKHGIHILLGTDSECGGKNE